MQNEVGIEETIDFLSVFIHCNRSVGVLVAGSCPMEKYEAGKARN